MKTIRYGETFSAGDASFIEGPAIGTNGPAIESVKEFRGNRKRKSQMVSVGKDTCFLDNTS